MKKFLFFLFILGALGAGAYFYYEQSLELENQKIENDRLKKQAQKSKDKEKIQTKITRNKLKDRDNDGLNSAEEKKLGTSDFKVDSDNDGVPDKYDIVPMGSGRKIVKFLQWNFKKQWKWEVQLPLDVVSYYEKVPRPKWKGDFSYYAEFIDASDEGIKALSSGLEKFIAQEGKNWNYYDKIMFVVSMVQQLHYTSDKLVGFDDYTKYPMQTINDGTGDCEDTAILAAALLHKLKYDVKLIFVDPKAGDAHLAIAVWGENIRGKHWLHNNKQYYYIETTDPKWKFGEFPPQWNKPETSFELISLN